MGEARYVDGGDEDADGEDSSENKIDRENKEGPMIGFLAPTSQNALVYKPHEHISKYSGDPHLLVCIA